MCIFLTGCAYASYATRMATPLYVCVLICCKVGWSGTVGGGEYSDIALDTIHIFSGNCPPSQGLPVSDANNHKHTCTHTHI